MKLPSYLITILLFSFIGCKETCNCDSNISKQTIKQSSIEDKIANLKDSKNNQIIVVSHRGDWRNAPENSLQAIQNCIDMGVDMVEIDIRKTKDGHLVVMHDKTINRTTNGKGFVKDWTLDSLKTLQLKDGLGVLTQHKIPTLKEALLVTKDKILVNLDKSYSIFDECFAIMQETETVNQVIVKGNITKQKVENEFGKYLDKVLFMPVIKLDKPEASKTVDEYMATNPPVAIEFVTKSDAAQEIKRFNKLREEGVSIWVNSLWAQHNGGHDDEKAALDPSVYDWFIDNNVDIIQTDRPQLLINYLRSKGLHN